MPKQKEGGCSLPLNKSSLKVSNSGENCLTQHRLNLTGKTIRQISFRCPLLTDDEEILFRILFGMESMYRHQLEKGGVDLPVLLVDVMTDFLSFDNLQKMEPSNNLCYRPLTVKRHKMREGISPLTTWSPHQSWSARWHNKNWSQSKMREGILLLNKPSLKVSSSMLKPNQHRISLTGKSIRHSSQMPTANWWWWWGNTLLDTYWCWKHVQASVTGGRGRPASSPLGWRNGRFHSLQKG